MSDVSIVVTFHSNKRYLDLCLETLVSTVPHSTEIVLVMNNADPKEIDFKVPYSQIRVVKEAKNLGYSRAVNLGAEYAKGSILVMCDFDTFYVDGWLQSLRATYAGNPTTGVASSKLLDPRSARVNDFGMGLSLYNNAHPFKGSLAHHPLVKNDRSVQMACSACMMISKQLFFDVGGMDVNLHNYYQDTDLCLRVNEAGLECRVSSDSVVYHRGDSSSSNRSPYRADIKGAYVAKNYNRMKVDMGKFFIEGYENFKKCCGFMNKYVYVDISSVADRNWHRNVISDLFPIEDCFEYPAAERDMAHLDIMSYASLQLINIKQPILYFVDSFCALRDNALWIDRRAHHEDVVVDRNANVLLLSDVGVL